MGEKIIVVLDKEMADVIPGYLKNREAELKELDSLRDAGDMGAIERIGHKLAGSGGGYGLDALTDMGRRLEAAAEAGDNAAVAAGIEDIRRYLADLEISYE